MSRGFRLRFCFSAALLSSSPPHPKPASLPSQPPSTNDSPQQPMDSSVKTREILVSGRVRSRTHPHSPHNPSLHIGLRSGEKQSLRGLWIVFCPHPLNGLDTENPERMDMVDVSSDELKPIPASIMDHTTCAGGGASGGPSLSDKRGALGQCSPRDY